MILSQINAKPRNRRYYRQQTESDSYSQQLQLYSQLQLESESEMMRKWINADTWNGNMNNHRYGTEQIFLEDQCLSVKDIGIHQNCLTKRQEEKLMEIELDLPACILQRLFEEENEDQRTDNQRTDNQTVVDFFGKFMEWENYDRFHSLVSISRSCDQIIETHCYVEDQNQDQDQDQDQNQDQDQYFETQRMKCPQMKKYYDDQYDMNVNYNVLNRINQNNIIKGKSLKFMEILVETYPDDEKIMKQFLLDFPRNTVYVNGKMIQTVDDFFEVITPFNREYVMYNENGDRKRIIATIPYAMTFVCQSSFYPSFIHLFNKLQKLRELEPDTDDLNNVHFTNTNERNVIEINVTQEKIQCALIAGFKLIDIQNEENVLYGVKAETIFDTDMDDYLIVYKTRD